MKISKPIAVTALSVLMSSTAKAESFVTEGEVTAVQPISSVVTIQEPYRECYPVEVPVYTEGQGQNDWVNPGTIVGGIAGGLLGNQIGKRKGKRVATIAGTILGGVIGNQTLGSGTRKPAGTITQTRCHTKYNSRQENRVVGYNVTYSAIDGRSGTVRTQRSYNVGDRVRVRVSYGIAE